MPGTARSSTASLRCIGWSRALNRSACEGGQHVLAVEFQETRLVRSRCMEHQMPEAETDIVTDPLDVLVGIAGDDPSTGGTLERQRVGEALVSTGSSTVIFSSGVSAAPPSGACSSSARALSVSNDTLTSIMRS